MSTVAAPPVTVTSDTRYSPDAAPPAVAVRLDDVVKRFAVPRGWKAAIRAPFGRTTVDVVQGATFEVREHEFFGLLGANGAGKTTLFKMLSTVVLPDSGTIEVLGHDAVRDGAAVRHVLAPVVTDERSLHWRLSARENLKLFAALQDVPREATAARIDEVLGVVDLTDAQHKTAASYSSGMRQRLLIARALLGRPKVLLLDEPTRSLDPISARALRTFLRDEIVGRQRCTVLLATHNAEEALELCDRVAVLERGRVLALGTARALAAEVGDERYRAWTADPHHPRWRALAAAGDAILGAPPERDEHDGWWTVELAVPGGADRAAAVLRDLSGAGVRIARFERVGLSLADLIDRVVTRSRARTDA